MTRRIGHASCSWVGTMVDSRIEQAMADRIDALTEDVQAVEKRVQTVGDKLDRLSASVDRRFEHVAQQFAQVDRRFDAVDTALLEQRQYTEFASARLEAKMDVGFARLEARTEAGDSRLEARMDAGFARVERVERKLDQFIDVQLQTNQLVERRLNALEQR